MAMNKAFLGHSLFAEYGIDNSMGRYARYGTPMPPPPQNDDEYVDRFVRALKDMEIATLWIQLFSRGDKKFDSTGTDKIRREKLLAKLAQNNIGWAGWGYCAGYQCTRNKTWIKDLRDDLHMSAFIIDAEPGNDVIYNPATGKYDAPDIWDATEFKDFVGHVNGLFGRDNLAITTWPILKTWEQNFNALTLMKSVADKACMFNPQVYWSGAAGAEAPLDYVKRTMKAWHDDGFANEIVVTGRSYWSAAGQEAIMNTKLKDFAAQFTGWNKLVGFGWYHSGLSTNKPDDGSMSEDMIKSLKAAYLGGKPYKQP